MAEGITSPRAKVYTVSKEMQEVSFRPSTFLRVGRQKTLLRFFHILFASYIIFPVQLHA